MVRVKKEEQPKTTQITKDQVKKEIANSQPNYVPGSIQQASGQLMIPPAIAAKLQHLGKTYNLPLDISNVTLGDGTLAGNIAAVRKIVEMVNNDSKLLPELLKLIKQLMRAEIKLAKFHKNLTKAAIKHQTKLDKQCADIFLAMAGFQAKTSKLEQKTNARTNLIQKRSQQWSTYYEDSVYGAEAQLIDTEFELAASNRQALTASKQQQLELKAQRKKESIDYINSAFQ